MGKQPPNVSALVTTWKILMIDDDEEDFLIAKDMLKDAKGRKIDLHWAASYEAGQRELAAEPYDAVLVDYNLGVHSGIELIREANQRGYAAPLILYTGRGSSEVDIEAMQAGASLYLTKSEANPLLLERGIRYAIERKQIEAALRSQEEMLRKSEAQLRASNERLAQELAERRQVEERLAYQAMLLQNIHDAVVATDANRIITIWNRGAERLYGWTAAEAVGRPVQEMIPTERTREQAQHAQRELLETGEFTGSMIQYARDGRRMWVECRGMVLIDAAGKITGMVSANRDITELKEAQTAFQAQTTALRESETRYRTFFENLRESVTMFEVVRDEQGRLVDFRIRDANPVALASMGLKREEALNLLASQVFPLEALERAVTNIPGLLETGETWADEQLVNGRYYLYTVFRMSDSMIAVSSLDITERKQAEEALRESQERLAEFMESTHDVFFILDHDWRILFANRRFAEVIHTNQEDLSGKVFWEIFPRSLGTPIEENCRKVMAERQSLHFEVGGLASDTWYEASVYPTRDGISVFAVDRTARKKAKEELQAAYARLRLYIDANIVGVVMGTPDGTLIEVNDYYLNLLGYTRAEYEAGLVNWRKLTPPEHLPADERVIAELRERRVSTPYEKEYYRKDGSRAWVYISNAILEDGTIAAFVLDITERKRAEEELHRNEAQLLLHSEALRENEQKYRNLFENSVDGVMITTPDGRIEAVNPAACAMFGMTEQEIVELGRSGILDTSDPRLALALEERQRTGYARSRELTAIRKNGEKFPVEIDSVILPVEPVRSFVILRDITERKKAEEALKASEERFRLMGETLPYGVWLCDTEGGAIYTSQSFLDLLEMTMEEMQGLGWTHRLPPDEVQPMLDKWMHSVRTGQDWDSEHHVLGPDGKYHTVLTRGKPVRDEQGNITCWVGINLDIDERKKMEEDLERANAALQDYAERLASSNRDLEQFAFTASHDLQEPLRKINQFGRSIQQRLKDRLDEDIQDNFNRMINAAERMQAMIQGLLELSRVNTQGRPFVQVDLTQVAAQVVSDLEPRILRTNGQVQVEDLPGIEADPVQIHQVLQNLIGNGLKFHKPGVPPRVVVSSTLVKSPQQKNPQVTIQVQDNGIGFDEAQFERILQPFQRLHGRSEYEGHGIGLAIVKKIIERHHGEINARSTPGEGSTFIITLPARQTG